MTAALRRRIQRVRSGGDAGFAMILVMGMSGIILGLVAVATVDGTRALRSSAAHVNYESSLAAAEAGIDATLQTISTQFAATATAYTSPAPCSMTAPGTFASAEAERTWARDALLALPTSCMDPSGRYVAVRPTNRQAVYSMGWYPDRASARAKKRLVKAEYLFAPYKPANAVLTESTLSFSGSVAVNAVGPAVAANVHANADVSGINGSTQVQGAVSATGTTTGCGAGIAGGCTSGQPQQGLPVISARNLYISQAVRNAASWYDLCPGGEVRSPALPANPSTGAPATTGTVGEPCTGPVLAAGGGHNGWTFSAGSGTTPGRWTLPRTAGGPFPGTYYAFRTDAQIGDTGNSSTLWQITVVAESAPTGGTAASCGKLGGNISWKLFRMTPRLAGLMLLADANLTGNANESAGSGLFLAGDKVDLNTSSATLTGAVIAGNRCAAAGGNTIQGVTINYDDTVEAPLSDVIRTSLWLEYPAG